jgi:hypothetical protein
MNVEVETRKLKRISQCLRRAMAEPPLSEFKHNHSDGEKGAR